MSTAPPPRRSALSARPFLTAVRARRQVCNAVVMSVLAVAFAGPTRAAAMEPCSTADVWLVSTRRLPGICQMPEEARLDVERLSEGDHGCWERATVEELLADPGVPLVVFIHGNRYTAREAKTEGLRFARWVATASPGPAPVRTVVFSWPSDKQGVLMCDVRNKYARAHADGHYLAWLLDRVEPTQPVALVGFSFGALVSLEALTDLAAADHGDGDGSPWTTRPGRTNVVFVAPAVRCDALSPHGPHRAALAGLDRLTVMSNSADVAMAFFPCVDRAVRAEALGITAMPRCWLPADLEYTAIDAAGIVGRRHCLKRYFDSATLSRRIVAGAVAGFDQPATE